MAAILIVDDEREIVTLMRVVLESAGHAVSEAHDGREALEALGVDPPNPAIRLPDVILLDVMMPVMDGFAVSEALRKDSRAVSVPIIVATAKGDMRPLFEKMPNVALFLAKPFEPKQLREAVSKTVAARGPGSR